MAFLRLTFDPPLTGGSNHRSALLRGNKDSLKLVGAIGCKALLRNAIDSLKLIGRGDTCVALLRGSFDPSLTGGSGHKVTFLCNFVGSHITLRHHHIRMNGLYIFDLPNIPNNFTFGHLLQDRR